MKDLALVTGVATGAAVMVFAPGEGAFLCGKWNSFLAVFCWGLAVTAMGFPVNILKSAPRLLANALRPRGRTPAQLRQRLEELAATTRTEGFLALEAHIPEEQGLLSHGLRLLVDGYEPRQVKQVLEAHLRCQEERQQQAQRWVDTLGRNWLVFGAAGALLAVILRANEDLTGIALGRQAAYPLFYGSILAALVAWPLARKIGEHAVDESAAGRMVIDGFLAMQTGEAPFRVRAMLHGYLFPRLPEEQLLPVRRAEAQDEPADEGDSVGGEDDIVVEEAAGPIDSPTTLSRLVRQAWGEGGTGDLQRQAVEEVLDRIERRGLGLAALLAVLSPSVRWQVLYGKPIPLPAPEDPLGPGQFKLDDCVELTDWEIKLLVAETDQWDLVFALSHAQPAVRQKFLGNMTQAQRMAFIERLSLVTTEETDANIAAERIALVARQLIDQGWITPPGDPDN